MWFEAAAGLLLAPALGLAGSGEVVGDDLVGGPVSVQRSLTVTLGYHRSIISEPDKIFLTSE